MASVQASNPQTSLPKGRLLQIKGGLVDTVLNSDFWFWALSSLAPDQLPRTLLAADPALLARVAPEERRRADADPLLRGRSLRHRRHGACPGGAHPECRYHPLSDRRHVWLGHNDDAAERIASVIGNPGAKLRNFMRSA